MSWLDSVWGTKPKVAKYTPVDLAKEQANAITANTEAMPGITKLGDLYSSDQLAQLEKILPGYGDQLSAGRATTDALFKQATPLLNGEIPQDVQDAVQRSSAYQALRGGYQGSPMAQALTARDLGLTSLDLIGKGASLSGQGVNSMQAWDQLARRDMLAPESMFVNPQLQAAVTASNNQAKQAYQQNKYNVEAAPDPAAKGVSDTLIGLISAYLSKGGGSTSANQPANPYSNAANYNQAANFGQTSYMPYTSYSEAQQMQPGGDMFPRTNMYGTGNYSGFGG